MKSATCWSWALLTFCVAVRSGLARLPAMRGAGIGLEEAAHAADFRDRLPSPVRRINDNYNHLTEQPTVFYGVALTIVALGAASPFLAGCALTYLVLRIAHSIVQATFNRVSVRAPIYGLSWIMLAIMILTALTRTMV